MVVAFVQVFGRPLTVGRGLGSARQCTDLRRSGSARVARRLPTTCTESKSKHPEPAVKSSYYKNPSRAIEKGGGFYIPGLRGPRLRFFVGGAVLLSLILNASSGLASGSIFESTSVALAAYATSSALAILGAVYVLVTAFQDVSVSSPKGPQPRPQQLSEVSGSSENVKTEYVSKQDEYSLHPDVQWVVDVVSDMMHGEAEVWIFRGQATPLCIYAKDHPVDPRHKQKFTAGPVVERVWTDSRVLYVADSSTLPSGVGFPFLGDDGIWSVFLVPLVRARCVFAVALPKLNPTLISMTLEDRRWIEALTDKVEETLMR
jgi:Cofactor assembly of complex C subunit B, CCB2/CCB4